MSVRRHARCAAIARRRSGRGRRPPGVDRSESARDDRPGSAPRRDRPRRRRGRDQQRQTGLPDVSTRLSQYPQRRASRHPMAAAPVPDPEPRVRARRDVDRRRPRGTEAAPAAPSPPLSLKRRCLAPAPRFRPARKSDPQCFVDGFDSLRRGAPSMCGAMVNGDVLGEPQRPQWWTAIDEVLAEDRVADYDARAEIVAFRERVGLPVDDALIEQVLAHAERGLAHPGVWETEQEAARRERGKALIDASEEAVEAYARIDVKGWGTDYPAGAAW